MSNEKIDLIVELGKEVKLLASKKTKLEHDIEDLERTLIAKESNTNKSIAQKEQEFKNKVQEGESELLKKNQELSRRERDIELKEKALVSIDKDYTALQKAKDTFKLEQKEVESLKASLADRIKLAELTIEQYHEKIKELK